LFTGLNPKTGIFPTLERTNGVGLREQQAARHDPARKESAIRQHTEKTAHDIHPGYGEILERNKTNYMYKRRVFLESLHSNIDKNPVNEKFELPWAYMHILSN